MSNNDKVDRYTIEDALKDILAGLKILNLTDGLINTAITNIQQQARLDRDAIEILQQQIVDLQRDVRELRGVRQ